MIAIGGNTLSRGLTLEGLVCSYFARTARNYDSLMQMGRWFGYRPGYRHLLRVWTTQGLFDWFQELDQVEQDLRKRVDLDAGQRLSPPTIRPTHSDVAEHEHHACRGDAIGVEGHLVLGSPSSILRGSTSIRQCWKSNQAAARKLANGLGIPRAGRHRRSCSVVSRWIASDRSCTTFGFHEEEKRLDKPSLDSYIDQGGAQPRGRGT